MSQIIERKEEKKISKVEGLKKLEAAKERDRELVTGIFRFIERPGSVLKFRFKKYADDPYEEYTLCDGQKYQLPRMVARHLNQNVHYVEYKKVDGIMMEAAPLTGTEQQVAKMQSMKKIRRCEFMSLEFMDDDLIPSDLIEVTARK